jgi:hypothetical protein
MSYYINNKQALSITSNHKVLIIVQLEENLVHYIDFIEELHTIKYFFPMYTTFTSLR